MFQHWFMLLFIVVLITGGTYAVCRYVPPSYRSKVSLIFQRPLNKSPISTDQGERALEVFVKAQQQIVMSDLVLARAKVTAEDDQLRKQWYDLRSAWDKARIGVDGDVTKIQARITAFVGGDEKKAGTVANKVNQLLSGDQKEFFDFRKSVKLETPGGEQVAMTETFTLTADRPSQPDKPESYKNAMYVADLVADMYMVRFQELQQELNDPALRVMRNVIDDFTKEVEKSIGAYEEFVQKNSNDIGVLEQLLKSGTEHGVQVVLTKVRENDAKLAMDLARDQAMYDVLRETLPKQTFESEGVAKMGDEEVATALSSVSVEFLTDNVGFNELVKSLAALETKRAKIESRSTESSRDMQYLKDEISQGKRQLLRAIAAHATGLAASIRARQQQRTMNEELVKTTTAEESEIQQKVVTYARLKNDFQTGLKHLQDLQQQRIDALANSLRARESVTIAKLDSASVPDPTRPVTPKTLLYTVVAFLVSMLLGVAFAFSADHFDHTLRSIGEAERYLGVPVLGSVKKRGRSLIVAT
jgi:capsular polysaccharide biosynthesis protein